MADTQRTRAQILAFLADNVTGQISEQDLRDVIVTLMEEEFAYAGDFWKQPETRKTTTDKSARGWMDYSQTVMSACSFMNILYQTLSGTWGTADVAASARNGVLGMAMNSYAISATNAQILRKGIVYNSTFSATFSGFVGRPIYLGSGVNGSITTALPSTTGARPIGYVEASDAGESAIGKWRFDPTGWAVIGV